jgi:hypothetical protein
MAPAFRYRWTPQLARIALHCPLAYGQFLHAATPLTSLARARPRHLDTLGLHPATHDIHTLRRRTDTTERSSTYRSSRCRPRSISLAGPTAHSHPCWPGAFAHRLDDGMTSHSARSRLSPIEDEACRWVRSPALADIMPSRRVSP